MSSHSVKENVIHEEKTSDAVQNATADHEVNTMGMTEEDLPPGYFYSPFFIGTMLGIGLGLLAGVAGFAYAAPILTVINAEIGPVSAASRWSV